MNFARIVIAGTHSGAGKSTVSLGLMAALRQRGLRVQGFKVGPDYIDPSYHTAITGRTSRNLDSWMLSHATVRDVFRRAAGDADVSVIEGVMGLYDGKGPLSNEGSTAEISALLDCPVVLVVDCAGVARSAAAMVKGYQELDRTLRIAGVIANRVGSEGHFRLVQQAVEQVCGIPVLGYLSHHPAMEIPERHLGLIPALERGDHDGLFRALGAAVAATVDLDAVLALAGAAPPLASLRPNAAGGKAEATRRTSEGGAKARIAVAMDAAFHFYYAENFDLLTDCGAQLLPFSPLAGDPVPEDADGLYIGGGFPETFAADLSRQQGVRTSVRERILNGLPTYAECGGYMYLTEQIVDMQGTAHDMVGVIPARVSMQPRLSGFGYREVTGVAGNWLVPPGATARGHEFHYSTIAYHGPQSFAWQGGLAGQGEGYLQGNLVAGYTHLHFASNPAVAQHFVERCASYRAAWTGRQESEA